MSLMTATELLMQGVRKLRPQDVFSTYLYAGQGTDFTVPMQLNLTTAGGLLWFKDRGPGSSQGGSDPTFLDTVRGITQSLKTNSTDAQNDLATSGVRNLTATSHDLGIDPHVGSRNKNYVRWALRRAKKFFDIVTYTGNGVVGRQIPHGLECAPGMVIIKSIDQTADWIAQHRSLATNNGEFMYFGTQSAVSSDKIYFNNIAADDKYFTLGNANVTNANGRKFVAYLFAHNPDLIDCGTYEGNGFNTNGPIVTCGTGWTPQFLLIKGLIAGLDWNIFDNVRSPANPRGAVLRSNSPSEESTTGNDINFLSNGFQPINPNSNTNQGGRKYIYLAIRSAT